MTPVGSHFVILKSQLSPLAALALLAVLCTARVSQRGEAAEKSTAGDDAGHFVRALWLVQSYGTPQSATPLHDEQTKALLAKALAKDGSLAQKATAKLLSVETFSRLAGGSARLDAAAVRQALEADAPAGRDRLAAPLLSHLEALTTSFDRLDEKRLAACEKLADWIAANYRAGRALDVVFVCSGNSRRSVLGAAMGNAAAAYYGLNDLRCHSGGTAPTAVNERSLAALRAIGFEVEATGDEAPPGPAGGKNPVYLVRWGRHASGDEPPMETTEFSKRYDDQANPQQGFAALMVCSEADAECPLVKGAALRLSLPYLDPKVYDGSALEAAKYAERRDDLGRLMLAATLLARRKLNEEGNR